MKKEIRILLVEDEALVAHWLKMELELMGYFICDVLSTGEEAVRTALDVLPDIILMDISLSDKLTGIEAAKQILSKKSIPIVFMTGYNPAHIKQETEDLKNTEVLVKPVTPTDIDKIVKTIFLA